MASFAYFVSHYETKWRHCVFCFTLWWKIRICWMVSDSKLCNNIANYGTNFNTIFKHYEPWLSNRMNKLLTSQIRSLTMYQSNEGTLCIVFENLPKSRIQHCERSELYLHFEWTKVHQKCHKWPIWRVFENLKLAVTQCYHLPDRSILISQILVENAKAEKLKCDILDDFRIL